MGSVYTIVSRACTYAVRYTKGEGEGKGRTYQAKQGYRSMLSLLRMTWLCVGLSGGSSTVHSLLCPALLLVRCRGDDGLRPCRRSLRAATVLSIYKGNLARETPCRVQHGICLPFAIGTLGVFPGGESR